MFKSFLKIIVVHILMFEARLVLKKYRPKIVAVTGSVGKTATKDAIATVLEKQFYVRKSEKSFNSEIGVPLAILGCQNAWGDLFRWLGVFAEGFALIALRNHYPKVLVLEVGTDRPGDIKKITAWLKPDIVVVTRIGEVPVHIEFFKSREELFKEKMNLVYALPKGGVLVLNTEDKDVYALGKKQEQLGNIVTFGASDDSVLKASHTEIIYAEDGKPVGIQCKVDYKGSIFPLKILGTIGVHYVSIGLAALGVGVAFEMNIIAILERLVEFKIPPGRLRILQGTHQTLLIDDSYNASPIAMEAALRSFRELANVSGRKIVVLGDMLELGKQSTEEHQKIGAYAAHTSTVLVTVGIRARGMGDGALDEGMKMEHIHHFDDAKRAATFLKHFLKEGDAVLVKGSQGMRMERIVEAIMAHPEQKKELLVRQEDEWLKR